MLSVSPQTLHRPRAQEASEADYPDSLLSDVINAPAEAGSNGKQLQSGGSNGRTLGRNTVPRVDSIADQLAFQNSLTLEKKGIKKGFYEKDAENGSKTKSKASWGFDDNSESETGNNKKQEFKVGTIDYCHNKR